MRKPDAANQLKEQVLRLEERRSVEAKELKEQLLSTYESLKPASIIKKTLHDMLASEEVKNDLTEAMLIVATRYVSKKIEAATTSPPHNMMKQLLGVTLQVALSSLVAKYSDQIKMLVSNVLNLLVCKPTEDLETNERRAE